MAETELEDSPNVIGEDPEKDPTIKIPTEQIVPSEEDRILVKAMQFDENSKDEELLDRETSDDYKAWGAGAFVELTTGFIGSGAQAAAVLKNLKTTKDVLGVAKVGGPAGFFASAVGQGVIQAGIWGLANTLGQTTRINLAENEKFSKGELFASSVFGGLGGPASKLGIKISQVTETIGGKAVDGVIKVSGETLANKGFFKGAIKTARITGKGGSIIIGGSSFAVAENAFTQELELLLNDRENRDVNELLLSGVLGGGANVVAKGGLKALDVGKVKFKEQLVKTAVGRRLQRRSIIKSKTRLTKEIADIEKVIKRAEKVDTDKDKTIIDFIAARKVEIREKKEAITILEDYAVELDKLSVKKGDKIEEVAKGKKPKTDKKETLKLTSEVSEDIDTQIDELKIIKDTEGDFETQIKKQAPIVSKGKQIKRELEAEYDDILTNLIAARKGKVDVELSSKELAQKALKNVERRLRVNGEFLDQLDKAWGETGLASQRRNEGRIPEVEGISERAKLERAALEASRDAYTELLEHGSKFEDLTSLFEGSKGRKPVNAAKETKASIARLKNKIKELRKQEGKELGLNKSVDTEETLALKKRVKELEASTVETDFDKVKKEMDDLLGIPLEDYNNLSKTEKSEFLFKRAAELDITKAQLNKAKSKINVKAKGLAKELKNLETLRSNADFYEKISRAAEFDTKASFSFFERFKSAARYYHQNRKFNMINQIRSTAPGILSGSFSLAHRGTSRAIARVIDRITPAHKSLKEAGIELDKPSLKQTAQIIFNDLLSTTKAIGFLTRKDHEFRKKGHGYLKSSTQSLKQMASETTGGVERSGYKDVFNLRAGEKSIAKQIAEEGNKAARTLEAKNSLRKQLSNLTISGAKGTKNAYDLISSLGLRGLNFADDTTFRALWRQASEQDAGARAIMKYPDDLKQQRKYKNQLLEEEYWTLGESGIKQAKITEQNIGLLNGVREDMFWASLDEGFEDLYLPTVEHILKGYDKWKKKDTPLTFFVESFVDNRMPFAQMGLRSISLGLKYDPITRVLGKKVIGGAIDKATKRNYFNPFNGPMNKLGDEIKDINRKINSGKYTKAEQSKFNATLEEKRNRLSLLAARRSQYNIDEYSRIITGATLAGAGYAAAELGLFTGDLNELTQKHIDELKDLGMNPYSITTDKGNIYLRSFAPAIDTFAAGATQYQLLRMKQNKELKENDKTWTKHVLSTLWASYEARLMENPYNVTGRDIRKILDDDPDLDFWAKVAGGAIPFPAEARNLVKIMNGEKYIKDLKGGTFFERVMYNSIGFSPAEYKFDIFGEPMINRNTTGSILARYLPMLPVLEEEKTQFQKLGATDPHSIIPRDFLPKDNVYEGFKARDFVNDEGNSLRTEFARRLRNTGIKKEVEEYIRQNKDLKQQLRAKDAEFPEVKGLELLRGVAGIIREKNNEVKKSFEQDAQTEEGRLRLNVYIGRAKEEGGEPPRFGNMLKEYLDLKNTDNPKRFYGDSIIWQD
tara:strand:- start:51 stop:4544 length:4494 start_codon:yes stop_codon:yes gene_type:complete